MNERYLFRGKRKDNREWAYGGLDTDWGLEPKDRDRYWIIQAYLDEALVIPETIGQCTGLKDKNGNWIFEGDIAKFRRFENNYIGKIIFNHKTAGFEFWWNIVAGAYGEKATYTANLSVCDEIEVFGSVHDNPELLEVSK